MAITEVLLSAFDGHNVEGVRAALAAGADACTLVRGKLPVVWLLEEYTRSDRLGECIRLLEEHGAVISDQALSFVLKNDSEAILAALQKNPSLIHHRTTLNSAFTPLAGVTLLHVAAEYGNLEAVQALLAAGADVNAKAQKDEQGLNGHTPLFHTVNSNANRSEPIMRVLIEAGADTGLRLEGITWGKGYEWETTLYDVTVVSYAQLGLLPQMHRCELDIFANIEYLLRASGRNAPTGSNVPNRYLSNGG